MTGEKKCVIDCNSESNEGKKYHEDVTFTCVSDCSKTSRKYINQNNECVEKCDDTKFHNYDSFSCVDSCSGSYKYESSLDKTCYDDCSKLSPIFYYDKDTKNCMNKCENLKFIYKFENGGSGDNSYSFYCLESCNTPIQKDGTNLVTPNFVHRYNDNICIKSCIVNRYISLYYHITEDNTCYRSCEEINKYKYRDEYSAGIKHYQYEYGTQCFNTNSTFADKLHYTMKSGIIKYRSSTTETDLVFCSKAGFYYIDRNSNECKNCEGYKIPYLFKANDDRIEKLGECLTTTCNNAYPYYNVDDKLCQKSCNHKKIISVVDSNLNLGTSEKGNCVIECPSDFKYESSNGTICYNKCPPFEQYFYKIGDKYKCIKDCTTISKFYIENTNGGECLDKCGSLNTGSVNTYTDITISSYIYYIPGNINNKCLVSCKDQTEYPFSLINRNSKRSSTMFNRMSIKISIL